VTSLYPSSTRRLLRTTRLVTAFFIASLVASALATFALTAEIGWPARLSGIDAAVATDSYTGLRSWIATLREGVTHAAENYPFLLYGIDRLAFAHLVIAVAFIGLYRDPVRNKWLVSFGIVACLGVVPLALLCGPLRGIPLYWQIVDCSSGLLGLIPLLWLRALIVRLQRRVGHGY